MGKYTGNDNYGNPKQLFIDKLGKVTDKELREFCDKYIWLSAYANNNPRSDYHWMCDACYDECYKRNKIDEIYHTAHEELMRNAR